MIAAVLFDLDDTLYPQAAWLDGAWAAVARAAVSYGVEPGPLEVALREVAAEGSDRGRIIDRALAAVGAGDVPVAPLVAAFRAHRVARLATYPGVRAALPALRRRVRVGLVTDGDTAIQRGKLHGLGLEDAFDVVVLSDELGREHRKPDPAPFRAALAALDVPPSAAVHVGDHPVKDVSGAWAAGIAPIRVRTGEHAGRDNERAPLADVADVAAAVAVVERLVGSAEVPA